MTRAFVLRNPKPYKQHDHAKRRLIPLFLTGTTYSQRTLPLSLNFCSAGSSAICAEHGGLL